MLQALKVSDYYKGAKKISFDGAPIKVASWYDTLGTDPEAKEALKPRGIKQAYYEGGHRMTIDGVPIRVAAHVKKWKAGNRAALGQGFDRFGLTIRPHAKRSYWGHLFTDRQDESPYWQKYHDITPLERYFTNEECIAKINDGSYSTWRPFHGLFEDRREYENKRQREADRAELGPNLWQWARIDQKRRRSHANAR